MHLELTEILVCPSCGPPHGLIAFVELMEDRRIVRGHLDCPLCEGRHSIRNGVVYLGVAPPPIVAGTDAETREVSPRGADEAAGLAAALLGPPDGSELLALAAEADDLAASIASVRPGATILAVGRGGSGPSRETAPSACASAPRVERVHRLVLPGEASVTGLPFRPGRLDGIVLRGPVPAWSVQDLAGVTATLRSGGRLVVLNPGEIPDPPTESGLRGLAADRRAWVAERI